ncbi:23S rRNA (pseudouridine(1915)-N(3))-methyltransferase RlmH [Pararhodospirillum oryzae]|uniref:Ribosomal RNA large subunit methyltransferase H n=1 Tax=Pararhodospirillum oryzae TaxID=478448 RepID=A0A512HA80_9PROT|nr:23S rRNA (pseudouridine(1915)-N(3))-methyltransferase RlmH [Pararhodospirillum oryzae]GEO82361.1 ribosomal RNA large subunit methyltransferase H [Pararhodospirillum oryzae]
MTPLIVAVGRSRPGPERVLFDHYAGRLRGGLAVVEVEEKRPLPVAARKAREAALILAQVPAGAVLIALDERGRAWSSPDLARALDGWRLEARPAVVFAIGGADGHGPAVLERADVKLALGTLTWPHQLVRALIAEQIYRAQCITAGHPYHRE